MKGTVLTLIVLAMAGTACFAQAKKTTATTTATKTTAKKKVTPDGFTVLPSGLEYKYIEDKPSKLASKVGDQIEMHFKSTVGDSILFDSRDMMKDKPVLFNMQSPNFNGDVNEGLLMLTPGDKAVFRTPLDSIVKAGNQLFPWMAEYDKMVYRVEVVSIKTQEEVQKQRDSIYQSLIAIDEKVLQDYFKANNVKPLKTESGLYYLIHKNGTGENAKSGQMVTVNYTGKTTDGNTFDSNVDSAFHHVQPFNFQLGRGSVIKGWDEGVALMNKGAKATLYIPSRYAYGPQSPSPAIPANAVLVFDIEVTDITGEASELPAPKPHDHSHDHGSHDGHQH